MTLKPFKKEFTRNGIPYPGSVLLDISPVLVELNNIQMLQLDQVVKNSFDLLLLIGNKNQAGQTFKTKLSKAVFLISAERAGIENDRHHHNPPLSSYKSQRILSGSAQLTAASLTTCLRSLHPKQKKTVGYYIVTKSQ